MAISNKILVLALILAFGLLVDAEAQTRRSKRKSHRTNTTVIKQQPIRPLILEPEVVSRAEDDLKAENSGVTDRDGNINPDPQRTTQTRPVKTTVATTGKNNSAKEKEERSLIDLERLSLAEGRAEAFRKQLSDVIEREAALRSKIDQLDYQMRPEIIQNETAVIGSLRPEQIRDSRHKMLENEKTRTNDQLTKVMESRTRLESAIVNADALVDKLRARVEAESNEDTQMGPEKITAKDSNAPQVPDN
jgi:hypothetical protein